MRRTGPLVAASLVWLLSLALVSTSAQSSGGSATPRKTNPHADVSLFTHSENCIACHNSLVTPAGEDVSIGATWRSTMMANSARDPYWQASVRRETTDHAARSGDIQRECAMCHMPIPPRMAANDAKFDVFSYLPFQQNDDRLLHRLAADSISCTVCHQIAADKLGTRDSFNGNFTLLPTPADGTRVIFGPYKIDAGRKTIMRSVSGFVQSEATHVKQSELCASCHTLITEALGPNGQPIGSLPEQMNYQEWLHSDFNKEQRSCQSCHMPAAEGPIRISSVLGDARESLSRHLFVGGNAFMVRMLNRYRNELAVAALPAELEATAKATVAQLQRETASVSVIAPQVTGGQLTFTVDVRNLSGHKFPTGYPARRAWLHVTVKNAQGRAVFESGAVEPSGAIVGNDSDANASAFEPHYEQITRPADVQIYESIMGDSAGRPTTGLLSAVRYLKDNRLLPRGFDKSTADAEIGVYGDAARDNDFLGAGDRTRYVVAGAGNEPLSIEVELRYQPIAFRWAHNLDTYDAPEPKRFVSYYNELSSASSVVVATASARVP